MKKCAYCGSTQNITREHVYPNFLLKEFPGGINYIGGIKKKVPTELTVNDVCKACNNGYLSELDQYASNSLIGYFKDNFVTKSVSFRYNYDYLLRWQLKILYNAIRAYKESTSYILNYVPYIMGKEQKPKNTFIIANILKSSFYNGQIYHPVDFGVSFLNILNEPNLLLNNAVCFRSYMFILLGWNSEATINEINSVLKMVLKEIGGVIISENDDNILLEPEKSNYDYIQHKMIQAEYNPWMISTSKEHRELKKYCPQGKEIKIHSLQKNQYNLSKVALITESEPYRAILACEFFHPDLVNEFTDENNIIISKASLAEVQRKGSKTFVNIVDLSEFGKPFLMGNQGIVQSNDNWKIFKKAILENDNYIFLASMPANVDLNKIKICLKIKVIKLEDENIV